VASSHCGNRVALLVTSKYGEEFSPVVNLKDEKSQGNGVRPLYCPSEVIVTDGYTTDCHHLL
jgi:hypothetical protein